MESSEIRQAARDALDVARLRPGQLPAIHALVDGHDVLAVLPTGAGKSAIYQLAGHLLGGLTVVVSPLIALQQDQLEALNAMDVGAAAILNSTLHAGERDAIFAGLADGSLRFLLLAPEQFANDETLARLQAAKPALFVVDEAHCISEWGHDFRPDYLRLGEVAVALGSPRLLALTATAAPPVRDEIIERLGMQSPRVIVRGFDRPNITLGVETFHDAEAKRHALIERVLAAEPPGIVYTATRRHAEEIAEVLTARGIRAAAYHAGMRAGERERVQDAFMRDEVAVIVATVAFGMGIDKSNVRFVFHEHISDAVDAYYQEVGRAGRDGEPAQAILFYRPEDMGVRRFLGASARITAEDAGHVLAVLRDEDAPVELAALRDATDLSEAKLNAIIDHLAADDVVEVTPHGDIALRDEPEDLAEASEAVAAAQAQRHRFERSRIEMMQGYAETDGCRRAYILNYFGEDFTSPCGNCDNCLAGIVNAPAALDIPFPLGSHVQHASLGAGTVMRYEGDTVTVLFESEGYQTLDLTLVQEHSLLQTAPENAA